MNPRHIKERYKLSYAQLAVLLQKDQRTVERYCHPNAQLPASVLSHCWLLDFYLGNCTSMPPYALEVGYDIN